MERSLHWIGPTIALAAMLAVVPHPAAAQSRASLAGPSSVEAFLDAPTPQLHGTVGRGLPDDRYLYRTLALGVPTTIVSALNLSDLEAGNMWLGLAGIGLGVGHGALFVAGLHEDSRPRGASALNAVASVYSTVSGILQIRSTFGDGPKPSAFRASVSPRVDGFRLRMSWKPAR